MSEFTYLVQHAVDLGLQNIEWRSLPSTLTFESPTEKLSPTADPPVR